MTGLGFTQSCHGDETKGRARVLLRLTCRHYTEFVPHTPLDPQVYCVITV